MINKTTRIGNRIKQLARDTSGVMLIEFAYTLPLVLSVVMGGTELTNYASKQMAINQAAIQLVDNASRMGDDVSTATKPVTEGDVNDVLVGGGLQFDRTNSLYLNGRVILSSVEPDPANAGKNRIRWQRCRGLKSVTSSYGLQGATNLIGVGPTGRKVIAPTGGAVMFVEVQYDYKPLFLDGFLDTQLLTSTAAMTVRDQRDFTPTTGLMPANNLHNDCQYFRLDGNNPS
jgi:hypothetical protein